MKKKILAFSLVISLLAIAVVGGTLAWFTDTDEATNTFTVGSVKIQQNEDFEQKSQLLPIVNTDDPAQDPNYVTKVVSVTNKGKNDAYIRTFIAVPKALDGKLILDTNGETWVEQWAWPTVTIDGTEYIVHCYVLNKILTPGTNSGDLLNGVYLDASVDVQENPAANNELQFCWKDDSGNLVFSGYAVADDTLVDVYVATQAVQADGFEASGPQGALNAAFGDIANNTSLPTFTTTTP